MMIETYTYLEKVFEIRKMWGERPWCCVVLGWYYEDNIKTKSEAIEIAEDYIEQNYEKIDQEEFWEYDEEEYEDDYEEYDEDDEWPDEEWT